ncbi:MAG TPA: hypothetical protein VHC69_34165 [Polyangiaceae bacterium]|nr:hypothetical protein [Polyangiaceae bacterium]
MTKRCLRYLTIARQLAVPGAALLPLACGGESNVLTRHNGGDGSGGRAYVDGGVSGGKSSEKDGRGAGGSSGNATGAGALGTDGGVNAGKDGSNNGSTGAASSGVDAAVDPHAMERATLASKFCALLDQYPCLFPLLIPPPSTPAGTMATPAQTTANCNQYVQVDAFDQDGCFDEWAAEMQCLISAPRTCPCNGTDCNLYLPGMKSSLCPTEDAAFSTCTSKFEPSAHLTSGTAGSCTWYLDTGHKCQVACGQRLVPLTVDDLQQLTFTADCDGPPNGPESCSCNLDGVPLENGTDGDSTYGWSFTAKNCADVSQKMSDGQCMDILNCCFTWFAPPVSGQPPVEHCSCLSDPMIKGLSSCDAVAAQGGGKVVDICPQYLEPAGFPQ